MDIMGVFVFVIEVLMDDFMDRKFIGCIELFIINIMWCNIFG